MKKVLQICGWCRNYKKCQKELRKKGYEVRLGICKSCWDFRFDYLPFEETGENIKEVWKKFLSDVERQNKKRE